jgi:hypothetical protein
VTVTELLVVETEVKTLLFCSMSMMVAPEGPTVPEEVVASAPLKVTDPKLAKGTRLEPSSKSSTIHSAFSWQRAEEEVSDLVTVLPVETFSITAVPALVLLAVTVSLIVLPAEMEIPEKS